MRIDPLEPTQRERDYWERHAAGKSVGRIAEEEGCDADIVRDVIVDLWSRDMDIWKASKRAARLAKP